MVLTCHQDAQNRGMVGHDFLSHCKVGVRIVNVARGEGLAPCVCPASLLGTGRRQHLQQMAVPVEGWRRGCDGWATQRLAARAGGGGAPRLRACSAQASTLLVLPAATPRGSHLRVPLSCVPCRGPARLRCGAGGARFRADRGAGAGRPVLGAVRPGGPCCAASQVSGKHGGEGVLVRPQGGVSWGAWRRCWLCPVVVAALVFALFWGEGGGGSPGARWLLPWQPHHKGIAAQLPYAILLSAELPCASGSAAGRTSRPTLPASRTSAVSI